MRPALLEVHIEELVLDGFTGLDRHAVADAVRRELAVRMGGRDAVAPSSRQHVDAGAFDAPSDLGANALGSRVAEQVVEALR